MAETFGITSNYILGYINKPINIDEIHNQENTYIDLSITIQVSVYKYNIVNFIANKEKDRFTHYIINKFMPFFVKKTGVLLQFYTNFSKLIFV